MPIVQDELDRLKGADPESILIRYASRQPRRGPDPILLHMELSKDQAVGAATELVLYIDSSPNNVAIFTDGSFDRERGGSGAAVCPALDLALTSALGIDPFFSNHECEAVGVLLAFKLIKLVAGQHSFLTAFIFTDNKGVLQRLLECNEEKSGQYIFLEILDAWNDIPENLDLKLVWCPGHQGIVGNELADRLAGEATGRNNTPDRKLKVNVNKLAMEIKRQINPVTKKTLKARISTLRIGFSSLINQLLCGHSPLHQHLFKAKRRSDPICPYCAGQETTIHLMNFCHKYKEARQQLRKNAGKIKIKFNWNNPCSLLKQPKALSLVAEFLKESGRFSYL